MITNTANNPLFPRLTTPTNDLVEQTKRSEVEMKAEELKKQKLVNHFKQLEEQKQLEGQMKFEALKAKLLAQKLANEEMAK